MKNSGNIAKVIIAVWCAVCGMGVSMAQRSAGASQTDNYFSSWKHIESGAEVDIRPSYLLPTNNFFKGDNQEGIKLKSAFSAHLRYRFSFAGDTRLGRMYPGAYQGVGVAYNNFFSHSMLGTPVSVYVFQGAPIVHFTSRLSLGYEWNFGAAIGWNPYDEESNSLNAVVGSKTTAYINVGFMLRYSLNRRWTLSAGVDFSHYSNGNTSWPNAGVNTLGGRVTATYNFDSAKHHDALAMADNDYFKPHWSYDIMVYGAAHRKIYKGGTEPQLLSGHFGVAGVNLSPMYNVCRYFNAGVSLDVQYDEAASLDDYYVQGSYSDDPKFYRPPFYKQITVGLSARAELVMPIFVVNVGFGRNLVGDANLRRFYQTLTLKTFVTRNLYLNVGYQLRDFKDPDNLMLGIGFRIHGKR